MTKPQAFRTVGAPIPRQDRPARSRTGAPPREMQAVVQDRLAQLLNSSPAVIYSFKATGDFAPTFVSENIKSLLGYEPREYLENADFWRRCVHPDELAAVEAEAVHVSWS
jgi:PAS domain-containing protein